MEPQIFQMVYVFLVPLFFKNSKCSTHRKPHVWASSFHALFYISIKLKIYIYGLSLLIHPPSIDFGYFPCLLKRDHINHFGWFFAHKYSIMGVDLKVKQEFLCEIQGRLLLPLIQQIHRLHGLGFITHFAIKYRSWSASEIVQGFLRSALPDACLLR